MLGAVAAIAKFSHGREWTLKYPSETMRKFCGKISNPFWKKGDNLLDIHRNDYGDYMIFLRTVCPDIKAHWKKM